MKGHELSAADAIAYNPRVVRRIVIDPSSILVNDERQLSPGLSSSYLICDMKLSGFWMLSRAASSASVTFYSMSSTLVS